MFKKLALSLVALALSASLAVAADSAVSGNFRLSCGTISATGGAATLANKCGVVTSEALTTAKGSEYTLTLTNSVAAATDIVLWSVQNGTNTTGEIVAARATPAAGSVVFVVKNLNEGALGVGASLTGTIKIQYLLLKP